MSGGIAAERGWESPATIPLVVGVTGHRDPHPDAIVSMREAFNATLDRLSGELPHAPIVVLSGLATGADQLAVRWACEWASSRPRLGDGARLRCVGVLPLDRDDYLRDFEPGPPRDDFESAERLCSYVFALPDPDGPPADSQAIRDGRYRDLGLFIARQSDVLVAFWDGKAVLKTGGTADVINFCTGGGLEPIERILWERPLSPFQIARPLLIEEERVPVVHILTPRQRDGAASTVLGYGAHTEGILRAGESWPLPPSFRERDWVNRHAAECGWVPDHDQSSRPSCLDGDERWVRFQARRRHLSGASSAMKDRIVRQEWGTIGLIVAAILLFQVFSSFLDGVALEAQPVEDAMRILLVLGYLALLAWGFLRLRESRRQRVDFVQATLRAVDEGMRLQAAILRAGVWDEQVGNWMTARTCQGTEPLRAMLRACVLETIALARDRGVRSLLRGAGNRGLAEAKDDWIREQVEYFGMQLKASSRRSRRIALFRRVKRVVGSLVFVVAIAMVLFTIVLFVTQHRFAEDLPKADLWIDIGTFLVGLSLAVFAGIEMAESSEQTTTELQEFQRMQVIYGIARRKIESAQSPDEVSRVVRALGKEAIAEVAEWYIRNRERAVETKLG
jgi:hypothetical protein